MSDWYWRVVALKAAFVLTVLTSYLRAEDVVQKLPYCNPHANNDGSAASDMVLVSTLDGKLTAFSTSTGDKVWDVETQPLLSSTLHHVELTSGGKWVRLVPSLRGTLYSLRGDTVEPLPFDAEQLLSSSFKYSDDLVIAGARETLWLGVDAATGAVVYECGSRGCSREQDGAGAGTGRNLVVLRRHATTVRALDPRTGHEKWNFSVGEHQLALNSRGCEGAAGAAAGAGPAGAGTRGEYSVGVALEGELAVTSSGGGERPAWKRKLDAPVAGMWRLRGGSLQNIDVLWAASKSLSTETFVQTTPPSLYIGSHNQQLYIQEGQLYVQKLVTAVASAPVPWRLKTAGPLLAGPDTALTTLQNSEPNTLALITMYGSPQADNRGFFLYHEANCDQAVQVTEEQLSVSDGAPATAAPGDGGADHHHIHVHVYSLWFWWKEVLLIAISSALLMNLMIWPRFFAPKPLPPLTPIHHFTKLYEVPIAAAPAAAPAPEYAGRYENDFTPLRCLGRGGFGVVFEARNNIDHRSYAVKRITLPRRESERDRVLREVRALAKLEHEHIVRYFNAWLEKPPANWQEQRDAVWMRELDGVSVAMSEDPPSARAPHSPYSPPSSPRSPHAPRDRDNVLLNLHAQLDYEGQLSEPSKRHRSMSHSDSYSIIFDENASKQPNIHTDSLPPRYTTYPTDTANRASGDNEDSFIVFANTADLNHNSKGLSEARGGADTAEKGNLELTKTVGSSVGKKKGHTRHWSLDMVVKGSAPAVRRSKMYLYIQMQLCRRDSLHDWLRDNRTYEARGDKVKTLFSQIVSAVEYVHLEGLIHRDLKPSNIFFAPDGKVKVGDFGLVTDMSDSSQDGDDSPEASEGNTNTRPRHTYRVGTHLYMSPEQLRGRPYSYKVDIYSLGLVLFELLQPFGTDSERVGCLLRLRGGRYPHAFHDKYPEEMELLRLMLSEDPSQRPTAAGVKSRAPLRQETDQRWHFTLPTAAGVK